MNKEFIPYEQALELNEMGFDEHCFTTTLFMDITRERDVKLPLYQQAFRWFREKGFISHITNDLSNNLKDEIYVYVMTKGYGSLIDRSEEYSTYEEAELACLNKLIEIVKNKKD